VTLHHGDVVVMGGATQTYFKHEIVKVSGARGLLIGPRVSITFRQFV